MKIADHTHSAAMPMDLGLSCPQWSRRNAHALAYGLFCAGAALAWCKTGEAFVTTDAMLLLAIVWFPPLITEIFRRSRIPNPAVASAILSGIAGYDGVLRLLRPWCHVGC